MPGSHKSLWLLFPVAFGATLYGALWLYFLPQLRAMATPAFGAGQMFGQVLLTSWGAVLVAAFCMLLRSPITALEAVLLGIALGACTFVLGILSYLPVAAGMSARAVALGYKLAVPAIAVWVYHRLRARRVGVGANAA